MPTKYTSWPCSHCCVLQAGRHPKLSVFMPSESYSFHLCKSNSCNLIRSVFHSVNLFFFLLYPFQYFPPLYLFCCIRRIPSLPGGIYFLNVPNTLLAKTVLPLLPSPYSRSHCEPPHMPAAFSTTPWCGPGPRPGPCIHTSWKAVLALPVDS